MPGSHVAAAWGLEAGDLRWFVEPDPATRATPSLSSYATWVSRCSTYRIGGWPTASSGSTVSLRRQPRPGRDLFDRFGDLLRSRAAVSSH